MNALKLLLILFLVLPAVTPWLPHESTHALHDHQAKHHGEQRHSHVHHGHENKAESEQPVHQPIHIDAVTYFSDYLHVDLQNPQQAFLKAPSPDAQDMDYTLVALIDPIPLYQLAAVQSRAPPDIRRMRPDKTPLYLSTQRLRI